MASNQGRSKAMDYVGWIAVAMMVIGGAVGFLRLAPALTAFGIYAIGGLIAIVAGLSALVASARRRGFGSGRAVALLAAMIFIVTAAPGFGPPPINDFTTDLADPPAFTHAATLPPNVGRDMSYPAEFADIQRECCADLVSLPESASPAQVFERVRVIAERMPTWEITKVDAESGVVEAVSTTRLFGFQDDVVIRIRPEGSGSRVDMRSKSRDGRGDQGVNAKRIRAFTEAMKSAP
jgi:uncharacterized protein (DUF1499 family)